MGRANHNARHLISPARDNVDVCAPRTLEKDRSGLDVQSDIHGSFLHSLRNPELLQAKRDHGIPKDLISPRSVRVLEALCGQKIHLVSRHDGDDVKRMITSRTYSEFPLSHDASLENYFSFLWRVCVTLPSNFV